MNENQITIVCERVKFYSAQDEDVFFEWLEKIKSITDIKGVKDTIVLFMASNKISDEELHNLCALFRRYKINTKKLSLFVNDDNLEAFSYFKHGHSINVYPANN